MLKLTLPRFRRLLAVLCSIPPPPRRPLLDSAASSPSSARFRHHLLDLEGDGSGCRSGRGVAREGSRAAPERGEQSSAGEGSRGAHPEKERGGAAERETRRNEWRVENERSSGGGFGIG
jgi:hypothetical protein